LNAEQQSYAASVGRNLGELWELQGEVQFLRDEFRGLESQFVADVGVLHKISREEGLMWNAAFSAGYLAENRTDSTELRDLQLGVRTDLESSLTSDLNLIFALSLAYRAQDFEDWRLKSKVGFATPVHPLVKFKAEWVTESMNKPAAGKVKTDYRTQFGLLAEF
jgi:hypothetical protein